MTSLSHCQTPQSQHSRVACGSTKKFDNDYDVIFACYKSNTVLIAIQVIPGDGNPQRRWTMFGGYSFKIPKFVPSI